MSFQTLRVLAKHPGETVLAMIALGLGIGLSTVLFSVLRAVAWSEPPFLQSERLVRIGMAPENILVVQKQMTSVVSAAGVGTTGANVVLGTLVKRMPVAYVSPNFFQVLEIQPAMGSPRSESEMKQSPGVMISHQVWRDDFRSTTDILGRDITINGRHFSVAGVMPESFGFPRSEQIWVLWDHAREARLGFQGRGSDAFILGRLKPGRSVAETQAEANLIWRRVEADSHRDPGPGAIDVLAYSKLNAKGEIKILLTAILGASLLVLLIACTDVAHLALARAARRLKEIAVRTALGASRGSIVRILLNESIALSIGGALIGVALSAFGLDLFESTLKREAQLTGGMPPWLHLQIDWLVLLFVAAITILAGIAAGLVPALRASDLDVEAVLRDSGHSTSLRSVRFGRTLIQIQLAGSIVLLVAAGLMSSVALGFRNELRYDPDRILTGRLSLENADSPSVLYSRLEEALKQISTVDAVALTSAEHVERTQSVEIEVEGRDTTRRMDLFGAGRQVITPDYFAVFSLPLSEGRQFDARDQSSSVRVAIVNSTLAQYCWPGTSAVGRRFRLHEGASADEWLQVAGVVPDPGSLRIARKALGPMIYVPYQQNPTGTMSFVLRSRVAPLSLISTVRRKAAELDPQLPIYQLHTAAEIKELEGIGFRVPTILLALCGASALILGSLGVYGVLSLATKQRTREVGIRLALGADSRTIVLMVLRDGFRHVLAGAAAGLVIAVGFGRLLASLFGPFEGELAIYAGVWALMMTIAFIALAIPSRSASRVSPLQALRRD